MSGKRILDAIALLRVGRNVAYNHFAIRLSQAELYVKTSSLTKAFKQRYPITSSVISQQFSQASFQQQSHNIPRANQADGPQVHANEEPGIKQDHHYERSEHNTANTSSNGEQLQPEQAQAQRYPLPDGTIPPAGSPLGQETGDPESKYKRPMANGDLAPLEEEDGKEAMDVAASGMSTIPDPLSAPLSSEEAKIAQRQSEAQIPHAPAAPPGEEPEMYIGQEKDVYYQPPNTTEPVLSALPRVKVPKTENDVQGGDSHIKKEGINADVYYSGAEAETQEPTEEQLNQLFHSPRAASLLGKKNKYMPGGAKKEFHISSVMRRDAQAEKEDLTKLAQDMAKDVQTASNDVSTI